MELHQLKYFCAVALAGSFTRAAEQEGTAQPTLSHQIQKLEAELGVPLFERLGRSVRLTQFGEDFLPRATLILKGVEESRLSIAAMGDGVRGRLTIGAIPTIMPYLIAPRIVEFSRLYPDLEVRLVEDMTSRLVQSLQLGALDVAVASLPVKYPDIVCSELFREPIRLAVSPSHRLAAQQSVEWTEIQNERLLLLKEGHCFREQVLSACTRSHAEMGTIFESDQFSTLFPLVASGFGLSLVPEMASAFAAGCILVPLGKSGVRRIGYLRNRRGFYSKAAKAFIAWLKEQSKQSPCG